MSRRASLGRVLTLMTLVLHAFGAIGWWWFMPGGFALDHPRFWLNQIFPWAVVLMSVLGMVGSFVRCRVLLATVWSFPWLWIAATATAFILFPKSAGFFGWLMISASVMVSLGPLCLGLWKGHPCVALPSSGAGALLGALALLAMRAPAPDTRPLNLPPPTATPIQIASPVVFERVELHPGKESVGFRAGNLTITIKPLLEFQGSSPDGFWSIFAPPSDRPRFDRTLRQVTRSAPANSPATALEALAFYDGRVPGVLQITGPGTGTPQR